MLAAVEGYEMFVTINNGRIVAYDIDSDTREIDWGTAGIMSSVEEEFAEAICTALDIKSVKDYGVTVHKDSDYE